LPTSSIVIVPSPLHSIITITPRQYMYQIEHEIWLKRREEHYRVSILGY
jgi:hypothetical protein